jgi:Ca2+/Na+ antiporter
MFTPKEFEPLVLTWWPLARDCSYYVLTLITLVIFMSDSVIEWWEALLQFFMYLGYVLLMKNSEALREKVQGMSSSVVPAGGSLDSAGGGGGERAVPGVDLGPDATAKERAMSLGGGSVSASFIERKKIEDLDPNVDFKRPSTFRAGILTLLTAKTDIMETAGVACVARIKVKMMKMA